MPLLDDEDRLAMLEGFCGLNSVEVVAPGGAFKALFTREAIDLQVGLVEVQSQDPALVCLQSDAIRLALSRGVPLSISGEGEFSVKDMPHGWPGDLGPGFTRLQLREP